MKNLHNFYNIHDLPWVHLVWNAYYVGREVPHVTKEIISFWWRDILTLNTYYRGIALCQVGNRETAFLGWSVAWLSTCAKISKNISLARNKNCSVLDFFQNSSIVSRFYIPSSTQAFTEHSILMQNLENTLLNPAQQDNWTYIWGNGRCSSSKFYKFISQCINAPRTYKWIWKSKCVVKQKVFIWLLLMDRLNTKDMLKRRHVIMVMTYNVYSVIKVSRKPQCTCFSHVNLVKHVGHF